MKILIDTNVLISAALFPGSVSALAVETVMKNPSEVILCDYVLKEMREVFIRNISSEDFGFEQFHIIH